MKRALTRLALMLAIILSCNGCVALLAGGAVGYLVAKDGQEDARRETLQSLCEAGNQKACDQLMVAAESN